MNLTHFAGLSNTGQHLIACQLNAPPNENSAQKIIEQLIQKKLLSPGALLLRAESYTYELPPSSFVQLNKLSAAQKELIEVLSTHTIHSTTSYLSRWAQALP